ncbi:winged helix-turn-helix domain-containing protein [candidate division KSB1 bacterium]|nr:winged helix-turn-helix domain-containing protein [candidate division KSB1 bacterium]
MQETLLPNSAKLVALHADVQEREYWLIHDRYAIGRLPDVCQIVVTRKIVSRIHAEIERRGSHFVLRNLSRNQTFVEGSPIEGEHILAHSEKIGLAVPEPLLAFADSDPTIIPVEILHYDPRAMIFHLKGQPIDLAPSEFRLLQHLYRRKGEVCTRESCAEAIWGKDFLPEMAADNLDKALFSLRKKLRKVDEGAELIKIRRGIGYVLEC